MQTGDKLSCYIVLLLIALAAGVQVQLETTVPDASFSNCIELNTNYGVRFYWTVNTDDETIESRLQANTPNGYVSVGLMGVDDEDPHPATADFFASVATSDDDSSDNCVSSCIFDGYMTNRNVRLDSNNDGDDSLEDVKVYKTDELLVGDFTRELDTSDDRDFVITLGESIELLYACNPDTTLRDSNNNMLNVHSLSDDDLGACYGRYTMDFGESYSCDGDDDDGGGNNDDVFDDDIFVVGDDANDDGMGGNTGGAVSSPGSFADPDTGLELDYVANYTTGLLIVRLRAPTTGYIGFGLGYDAAHAADGSDMYVVWVDDESGEANVLDLFSTGKSLPPADDSQDATVIAGLQVDGTTTVEFSRPLDTGDTFDFPIENQEVKLFWSIGADDVSGTSFSQHSTSGTLVGNLITGSVSAVDKPLFKDAGQALCAFVFATLGVWIGLRWLNKLTKQYQRASLPVMSKHVQLGGLPGAGAQVRKSKAPNITGTEVSGYYGPKKERSATSNKIHGFLLKRIPYTSISIKDTLIGGSYVLLHVIILAGKSAQWTTENSLGSLAGANALFVALPASRNSLLILLLGIDYSGAIRCHRFLGRWIVVLVACHFMLFLSKWSSTPGAASDNLSIQANLFGIFAGVCLVIILLTSLYIVRRKQWQFFVITHNFFVLFYIFVCLHAPSLVVYGVVALVWWSVDRSVRLIRSWPQKPTNVTVLDDDVVRIQFSRSRFSGKYDVGSYVYISVPGISWMEWHPISVASGPLEHNAEVVIKGLGDYTTKLVALARQNKLDRIRVDGAYGRFRVNARRYKTVVLVGGGIGAAPLVSMVRFIYDINVPLERRMHTLGNSIRDVFFVWVAKNQRDYMWFRDILKEALNLAENPELPRLSCWIYLSREAQGLDDPNVVLGHPDIPQLFETAQTASDTRRFGVYCCGPSGLCNDVRDECATRSKGTYRFDCCMQTYEQ